MVIRKGCNPYGRRKPFRQPRKGLQFAKHVLASHPGVVGTSAVDLDRDCVRLIRLVERTSTYRHAVDLWPERRLNHTADGPSFAFIEREAHGPL